MKRLPVYYQLIPAASMTLLLFGVIGFSMLNVSAQDLPEEKKEVQTEKLFVTVADC